MESRAVVSHDHANIILIRKVCEHDMSAKYLDNA